MTTGIHAVVWIDASQARVVSVDAHSTGEIVERPDGTTHHARARAGSREGYRTTVDHVFFQRVANDLARVKSFVVVGPANMKTEFVKHLHHYDPQLFPRLAAVETADHMTDAQLVALARDYFKRYERAIPHPVDI